MAQVYATLACQMVVTLGFVAIFLHYPSARSWVKRTANEFPFIWVAAYTPVVLCGIPLMFKDSVRRKAPVNFIWLVIFTLATSFLLGLISVFYDTQSPTRNEPHDDTDVQPQQDNADRPPSYSTLFNTTPESPQYDSEPPGYAPPDAIHMPPHWHYDALPPSYVCLPMPHDDAQMTPQPAGDVSDATQNNDEDTRGVFADKSVRNLFVSKVYATLACQMLVTSGLIAIFLHYPSDKSWAKATTTEFPFIWAAPVTPFVLCVMMLIFGTRIYRQTPFNFLVIFTLSKSFLLGFISSFCDTQSIFMAVCLTAVVCLVLTLFGYRLCSGILACFAIVPLLSYSIFWLSLLNERPDQVAALVGASVVPILVALFLAYAIMQTVCNNNHSVLPHEYIFAAVNVYWEFIECIMLIICIVFLSLGLFLLYGICDFCRGEKNQDDCQSEEAETGSLSAPDNKV